MKYKDTPQRRPNVIVFLSDQQRWDTTGVHGNPMLLTPNFDRLASEGTHLKYCFTCQPLCGPARSCIQTGRYATTTGCFRNMIPLPAGEKTLANYFREAGYTTGYIGKWHLASGDPVVEKERGGYEKWLAANTLEFTSDSYDCRLYDNDNREVKLPGYRVDALADAAVRFIDKQQNHSFFLFLSFLEPHQQNHLDDFPPPDGYREIYTGGWIPPDLQALGGSTDQHLGGYYGMVKRLDEALGRIRDCLKSLDLSENTIVLFTSDHGCHFKTRNDEYKRSCHESSVRIPAALIGPGFFGGGCRQEMVSLVDLAPTLVDAANIPLDEEMQGRSLMPYLRGEADNWPQEVFIQISESQVGRAIRTRRWKYSVRAVDKDPWKDPAADKYEEANLYDLKSDPYELSNLIGLQSHVELAATLSEILITRMTDAGEKAPEIIRAPIRHEKFQHISAKDIHL